MAVLKLGRRTANPSVIHGYLKDYFGPYVAEDDESDPDRFELQNSLLTKLLIQASGNSMCVRELNLVRQGAKFLGECGDHGSRMQALSVAKGLCLDSFRLVHETPDDTGQCLVQIAKSFKYVDDLHRVAAGIQEDDSQVLDTEIRNSIVDLRYLVESLYEHAGFTRKLGGCGGCGALVFNFVWSPKLEPGAAASCWKKPSFVQNFLLCWPGC